MGGCFDGVMRKGLSGEVTKTLRAERCEGVSHQEGQSGEHAVQETGVREGPAAGGAGHTGDPGSEQFRWILASDGRST